MNASGRLNTCKSRGIVAILETGGRVRNAYATFLMQGDILRKRRLIPHKHLDLPGFKWKAEAA